MINNLTHFSIGLLFLFPAIVSAQTTKVDLSLEQSMELLQKGNRSIRMAGMEVELAKNEHQKLNSFWYPSVGAAGAFVHMSNPVEVRQPIDASVTWPVFTGGKRIFANKIGKTMVGIAEVNREQVNADQQSKLIECYFGLRLGQRVVTVREATYNSLKTHYDQALKLEQNGMINRAERLFAQVSMDEAKRELESARKDLEVAQQALKSLIDVDADSEISTTTALFINENIPSADYFKELVPVNNYLVNQLKLQENIAGNELKIGRTGYLPTIALFGKQTLYSNGVDKYLMPRTMIGVGFTWNIFDGLSREKKIRQARLTSQTLAIGKDKAVTELKVGVDKYYTQLQNALDNVKALNTTLEMSEELVRIRQKSFQEGMATSTEVVDAEVMLSKVKTAFLLAYYQYDVALINLLSICGIPESFQQYRQEGTTEII